MGAPRQKASPLTREQWDAINEERKAQGLFPMAPPSTETDPPPAPRVDITDAEVPRTADALSLEIARGLVRGLRLATSSKEIAELGKVMVDFYKVRFSQMPDDDLGAGLGGAKNA